MARSLRMQDLNHFVKRMGSRKNGVVERKNRVIQEMARVMLLNKQIPQKIWAEAISTSCHIGN